MTAILVNKRSSLDTGIPLSDDRSPAKRESATKRRIPARSATLPSAVAVSLMVHGRADEFSTPSPRKDRIQPGIAATAIIPIPAATVRAIHRLFRDTSRSPSLRYKAKQNRGTVAAKRYPTNIAAIGASFPIFDPSASI